ncbi:MAG: pentapeptide repeat-containing protein [Vibrio sp.]
MQPINNHAQYYDSHFETLNLTELAFNDVEFEDCVFTDCDFSKAAFTHSKFNNCTFERCNLSLMDVSSTKLFELAFIDCKLLGIDWVKAVWAFYHRDFNLSFVRCVLNDGSFFGLTLHELVLDACTVHNVDFRDGDYTDSSMTDCDFRHSLFMHTNLQSVDFSDSFNYVIDVLENNVKKATFSLPEAMNLLEGLGIVLVD